MVNLSNIPSAQPLAYDANSRSWCYGCGCSGKRTCFAVPEDMLVVPLAYGAHILDGKRHYFQHGYVAICASVEAANDAVARGVARRIGSSDFRMPAMRAF